jgi:prepilin-type N-terminal cleavage/methylation domain-containing protein
VSGIYNKTQKEGGFTLLEVVVALVILAISFTVLIEIQSRYISLNSENIEKIRALKYMKEYIYSIPVKEKEENIKVEEKKELYEENVNRITYSLIKDNKLILEMYRYEFTK